MSASDAFEQALCLLYFEATAWSLVADNAGTTPITNWQFSLHTADPGDAGNQTTSEIAYTDYVREAVARSSSGFDTTGGVVNPAANIEFTIGSGGSGTATFFGIGTASTSTGVLHISGAVTPNIVCGSGITPILTTATSISVT